MRSQLSYAVAVLAVALLLLGLTAQPGHAEPAPAHWPPETARGWEVPPTDGGGVPVLSPVVAGLRKAGAFAFTLVMAPFRGALWVEDRYEVLSKVENFFYNDARTIGVLPSVSFTSGFGGEIGLGAFYADMFGHDEKLSISGSAGGADRYSAQAKLAMPEIAGGRLYLFARARLEKDDQLLFRGIGNADVSAGPLAPGPESRFAQQRLLGLLSAGVQLGKKRRVRMGFSVIYNEREFSQDVGSGLTPIGDHYDVMQLRGFAGGVNTAELTTDIQVDLRDHAGQTGSGALLTGFGGAGVGDDWQYAHYGAEASLYWTPWRSRRVFIVRATHEGVSGDDIPFTELPRLGGVGLLRGYRRDRFRDELALVGTAEYRYPIHGSVSGALYVEGGKVARTYEQLLGSGLSDNWHVGYGGGFVVHSEDSAAFRIDVAYGDGVQVYFSTDVLQAFRKREREL